jgi:hypothetical protein
MPLGDKKIFIVTKFNMRFILLSNLTSDPGIGKRFRQKPLSKRLHVLEFKNISKLIKRKTFGLCLNKGLVRHCIWCEKAISPPIFAALR